MEKISIPDSLPPNPFSTGMPDVHPHLSKQDERETIESLQAELEVLRRQADQFRKTNVNLGKRVDRLARALERMRKRSPFYRIQKLTSPRLGVFVQHRPKPLRLPKAYDERPDLADPPGISIVTPSFQQGEFIERTLCSVLNQEYPKLEYTIQDGGSTDGTLAVLNRYKTRLKRFESKKDKGQAQAINLGFRDSSSEIMAYLNSDDILLPGALHYVAAYFQEHPEVDVLYGHRVVVDMFDREIGRWILPEHDDDVLLWADFVPQETLFWRRRIWDHIGGKVDEGLQFALDWDLLLRFRKVGAIMVCVPRFLGAFRHHALQKTTAVYEDIGLTEMDIVRQRYLGQTPTGKEIARNLKSYLRRHVVRHLLYQFGFLNL